MTDPDALLAIGLRRSDWLVIERALLGAGTPHALDILGVIGRSKDAALVSMTPNAVNKRTQYERRKARRVRTAS